jgi:hypothetical protein
MAQGISSDQLFGYHDDDTSEARHERMTKLSALHGARAISSDMYFNDGSTPMNPMDGSQNFDAREVRQGRSFD